MKVNDIIEVNFFDIDYNFNGVGKYENYIVFSRYVLPNETWNIKIKSINKNIIQGLPIKPLELSKERINQICPNFPKCGGCDSLHLDYDNQINYKLNYLKETLKKVGNITNDIDKIIKSDNQYYYRNKVQMPFNDNTYGFYESNTNNIIKTNNCFIHFKINNDIYNDISNLLINNPLDLRHIVIRNSYYYQDIMIIFILRKKQDIKNIITPLLNKYQNIKSIYININNTNSNVIFGDKEYLIYGEKTIKDKILNLDYLISPKSFFQINNLQTEKLYQEAINLANLSKNNNVIDAYCGIGTISLSLSKYVNKVYGIEIVEDAIKDANKNKVLNNINNVDFILGKSEDVIPNLLKYNKIDILFVDPPRKGLDSKLVNTILNNHINKIIYISCNPATLARDLKLLSNNYNINNITMVDMFPNTKHVESVVLMSRGDK